MNRMAIRGMVKRRCMAMTGSTRTNRLWRLRRLSRAMELWWSIFGREWNLIKCLADDGFRTDFEERAKMRDVRTGDARMLAEHTCFKHTSVVEVGVARLYPIVHT